MTGTKGKDVATKKVSPCGTIQKPCSEDSRKRGWEEIANLLSDGKKQKLQKSDADAKRSSEAKLRKKKADQKPNRDEDQWIDDGLGGVYNSEGYTGRIQDGVKIFKAHVLRNPNSGNTPQCPFDCDCCFI